MSKIYHEVLLLMKFLQTKPDVKKMNIIYFDLFYTVNKVRDENEHIDNQYEDDDYINFMISQLLIIIYQSNLLK